MPAMDRRTVGQLVAEASEFGQQAEGLQRKAVAVQSAASALSAALQEFAATIADMSGNVATTPGPSEDDGEDVGATAGVLAEAAAAFNAVSTCVQVGRALAAAVGCADVVPFFPGD